MYLDLDRKKEILIDRAHMHKKARSFFEQKNVLELDCPILNKFPNIDNYIDPIEVKYSSNQIGYLHTCPELTMKKWLSRGFPDCYFLNHVFRDFEKGNQHSIEFMMMEWYRKELSFEPFITETIDFIKLFFDVIDVQYLSYREVFKRYIKLDYAQATFDQLKNYIEKNIDGAKIKPQDNKNDLISFIFAHQVEPQLKEHNLVVIHNYPKEQAALAKTVENDDLEEALRFEIYFKGLELANGYDELLGSKVLLKRFEETNQARISLGKNELEIDLEFVEANGSLPNCCGVAVGFDRLMMLRHNETQIDLVKLP